MKNLLLLILFVFSLIACVSVDNKTELPKVSEGNIVRVDIFQSHYVTPRNIDIWLPEGYSDDKKYAVVYMHDGQMLYDSTSSWNKQEWGVDEVVSKLINENKIKDCIVVGVWNSGSGRHGDYFPQSAFDLLPDSIREAALNGEYNNYFPYGFQSNNYLNFMVNELKPYIDNNYSTLPDKENTIVIGSSMGGLISMYAICEYPDIYGGAGCMSTHWPGITDIYNNPIPGAFAAYLANNYPDPIDHKIYFDYGTQTLDSLYEPSQLVIDSVMHMAGYNSRNWSTLKFEGHNHSERAWNKRFNEPLEFLIGK